MNNPQAFPSNISNDLNTLAAGIHQGMTLRDYFAGHIAQAITSNLHMYKIDITNVEIAVRAYSVADAMLAERSRKDSTNETS